MTQARRRGIVVIGGAPGGYRCSACGRRGHNIRTCPDPEAVEWRAARGIPEPEIATVTPVQ